ncbi:hypothetical protein BKA93DRAFT_160068 [Sparassis latifolia]
MESHLFALQRREVDGAQLLWHSITVALKYCGTQLLWCSTTVALWVSPYETLMRAVYPMTILLFQSGSWRLREIDHLGKFKLVASTDLEVRALVVPTARLRIIFIPSSRDCIGGCLHFPRRKKGIPYHLNSTSN